MTRFLPIVLALSAISCGVPPMSAPSVVMLSTDASDSGARVFQDTDRKTYLDVRLETDTDGDNTISRGDAIFVNFGIAPSVHDDVNAWVRCSQAGAVMYERSYNRSAWPAVPIFALDWAMGGADCRVTLETAGKQSSRTLAETSFLVMP